MLKIQKGQNDVHNLPIRFQQGTWHVSESIKTTNDPDESGHVAYKTAEEIFKKHAAEIPDKVDLNYENPWGLHRITLTVNNSKCPKDAYTEFLVRQFEGWKFWKSEAIEKLIQRAIKRSHELVLKLQ